MLKQTPKITGDTNGAIFALDASNDVSISTSILESCTEYAIVGLDLKLNIIAWNEGASRLFQYQSMDMIGKANLSLIHLPEELQTVNIQHIIDEVNQSGLWTGELKCKNKAGEMFPVIYTLTLRKKALDELIGYTLVIHNLTKLNLELARLVETKEYTRSLIESNMDVLMTTDSLGVINDVNQQICELTGLSRAELIGSPFKIHFTEPLRAEDLIRQVLSENRITNYELYIKSVDEKITPVSFNATTFRSIDGRLKGIFATARNITEQKRLETESHLQSDELLEATNFLNDILKSSVSNSIIALDLEGNILIWNEGARCNYGYTSEEIVGKHQVWILFTPEDIHSNRAKEAFNEALRTGTYDGVFERVRKNGQRFPALVSISVRKEANGTPIGYVLISKDITAQKKQEKVLQEQLSYNRSLFESSIDVLMATDMLGIITDVNKQMCAVTGYSHEELIGTQFKNYFTDPKLAEDCIRDVLMSGKVKNYQLTIKAKDGKETVISCNASTFEGTDHKLRGVFAVARDITEQKRLEVESLEQNVKLKEATGFLNNVLESSTAYSIIAEDLEGNILAWNEGARLNYGYTADEMIGKQNTRILHAPEDIQSGRLQAVLDAALQTGKEEGLLESVRKNGERFTASLALTLRKDAAGKPVGYLLISKDITDQKREEVLISKNVELVEENRLTNEANRLKGEFLANMSHELRSPLNGIIGFTELMHLGKVGPVSAKHKEYLGDILASSRHLLQLINDILDLAKVESGKMEFHPEKVNLNTILNEVCDILRTLIFNRKVKLTTNIDPSVASIIIDPAKLKQILYNYISNALKFTEEEGTIDVRVMPEGEESFRLEVQDSGIGIREEDLHKLFAEFQQLDASSDKKYQGTGLGLALTRRIAQAQGGQVGVTSIVGKGSTFYVILPKVPHLFNPKQPQNQPQPQESAASDEIPLSNLPDVTKEISASVDKTTTSISSDKKISPTVLVIEDVPKDSALISKALIKEGYDVDVAFTGSQAIKLCQAKQYDVITLDLLLPDMNGWEILRGLRSHGANLETPTIVVTVVESKAMSFGFMIQSFLTKPITSENLISALQQTGVFENQSKTILFIDDDPHMHSLCQQYLEHYGATILCETDPTQGLIIAEQKLPDVIVLDLLMPVMDG